MTTALYGGQLPNKNNMIDPNFIFNIPSGDIVYDIETYPNVFTITIRHAVTERKWVMEISGRTNDLLRMVVFVYESKRVGNRWVGFNNIGFDYPVLHFIITNHSSFVGTADIYNKAQSIISTPHDQRFANLVHEDKWIVPQLDLYKIHHFDNAARSTSLKILEFNMRMDNIEDLPFPPGTTLTDSQIDELLDYNDHDVMATLKFYRISQSKIEFREVLSDKYGFSFINHNDTKIGKDIFINKLEEHSPGCCYGYVGRKKVIRQTPRESISLYEVILPYINFEHSEFQRIHDWFRSTTIVETKGSITGVNCTINGFRYDFGTGGLHGAADTGTYKSDDDYVICSMDVASMYPNIAIVNGLHPEHLGSTFCSIYKDMYEERKTHKKGSSENAMLKLALNGVYGDSNNKYSPFYDPKYTMTITVSGQLSLCMLIEMLIKAPDSKMLMVNTDGIEIIIRREHLKWLQEVCKYWEYLTGLKLEHATYNRLFIRDCNNYVAESCDGDIKRKGAYEYNLDWHQNHSATIVPKIACRALLLGINIAHAVTHHDDVFDFLLRTKVPRSSILELGGLVVSNVTRYYIANNGRPLEKVMPPKGISGEYKRANNLTDTYYHQIMDEIGAGVWDERIHTKNKSVYAERRIGINTGWLVCECNRMPKLRAGSRLLLGNTINYDWYIKEVMQLVTSVREGG